MRLKLSWLIGSQLALLGKGQNLRQPALASLLARRSRFREPLQVRRHAEPSARASDTWR